MKICTECCIEKELSEFGERKNRKGVLVSLPQCKECYKNYKHNYYEKHKEISRVVQKKRYEANKEWIKEQARQYRKNNKEKISLRNANYRALLNKESVREYNSQYQNTYKEKIKNQRLKYSYGITLDDYKRMCIKQNNQCAICCKEKKLYVDHNHETGKIRGLLCRACNCALGIFEDSVDIANNMIQYLKKEKKMKLSNQAIGAFMMALQKCLAEQIDITEIMKDLKLSKDEEGNLIVLNPPVFTMPVKESEIIT